MKDVKTLLSDGFFAGNPGNTPGSPIKGSYPPVVVDGKYPIGDTIQDRCELCFLRSILLAFIPGLLFLLLFS